jgi:hypothetical protein
VVQLRRRQHEVAHFYQDGAAYHIRYVQLDGRPRCGQQLHHREYGHSRNEQPAELGSPAVRHDLRHPVYQLTGHEQQRGIGGDHGENAQQGVQRVPACHLQTVSEKTKHGFCSLSVRNSEVRTPAGVPTHRAVDGSRWCPG